jgi:hypothetical protein
VKCYTEINEVLHNERSWTYLKVLFELLFCLTKLLSMAMAPNFDIMLGQTLNCCV